MSQLQVTGEAKIRDIQGPVVANSGVITALDGAASQYVRGDGTLADFPTSSGGGSSVSYYLNSSVSQGTIGGVAYRELSKEPIIGAGTDIAISSNGYVANYITDVNDPDVVLIPGGNFNCEFYFSVNNNTGNPFFYAELYKYDGTTFTLLGSSVGVPEYITQGTTIAPYYFAIPVATATLALTDRLAIRIYVNVDGRTVTLHTENGHLCQVVTTLSKGMVSLNNLTDQSQNLTTGTSGTNFAIVSSGDTHTFNIPDASPTARGLITTSTQNIAGSKTFNDAIGANYGIALYNGAIPPITSIYYAALSGNSTGLSITYRTGGGTNYTNNLNFPANNNSYAFPATGGTIALTSDLHNPVTIGTANGLSLSTQVLSLALASTSANGALSSTDWNTFNGKQAALNGTGFVKISGTTISYDNSTYLTTSAAASTYLPLSGGTLTGALNGTSAVFSGSVTSSQLIATDVESGVYANYYGTYSGGSTPLSFLYGSTGSVTWNNGGVKMTLTSAGALQVASSLSATSATLNGNVTINSTAAALSPLQVVATGTIVRLGEQSGTTGKQFLIGIDATSGRSELQSVWQGTGFTSLALQPSGGNVLIGTTGDNGARLQVSGTATISSTITAAGLSKIGDVFVGGRSGTYAAYSDGVFGDNLHLGATSSGGAVYINTALSRNLIINPVGGNVVIGGSTAQNNATNRGNLTINGTTSILNLSISDTNGGYLYHGGTDMLLVNAKNGAQLFYTNDTERMRITSGGGVLVGTTTNQIYSKLIVAGGICYNNNTDDEVADNGYGMSFAKKINIVAGSGANTIYSAAGSEGALYVVSGLNLTTASRFVDLVLYLGAASTAPIVVSSRELGGPVVRTYTNVGENLTLSLTGNTNTYTIRMTGMGANEKT